MSSDDEAPLHQTLDTSAATETTQPAPSAPTMQGVQLGDHTTQVNYFHGPWPLNHLAPADLPTADRTDSGSQPAPQPSPRMARRVELSTVAGSGSATGLAAGLLTRTLLAGAVLLILHRATAPLESNWQWAIALPVACLIVWRVNGRDLVIASTTTQLKPLPLEPPQGCGSPIPVHEVEAGTWFGLETDYQAALLLQAKINQEHAEEEQSLREADGRAFREAYNDNRRRARSERMQLRDEYYLQWHAYRIGEISHPPTRPQLPTTEEIEEWAEAQAAKAVPVRASTPLRQEAVAEPLHHLAVVIAPLPSGRWAIGLQDGSVIDVGPDDALRIHERRRSPDFNQGQQRIADQIRALLDFVAAHDGEVLTPDQARLPQGNSPHANWECHQALRQAARWGLLRVAHRRPWRWLLLTGKALTGSDIPLTEAPLDLALTRTGQLWLDVHPAD